MGGKLQCWGGSPLRELKSEVNVTGGASQRGHRGLAHSAQSSEMTSNYFWQDKHHMSLPLGAKNKGRRPRGINFLKGDTIFNLAAFKSPSPVFCSSAMGNSRFCLNRVVFRSKDASIANLILEEIADLKLKF